MNTDRSIEEVNEHRRYYRRCRYCEHASNSRGGWFCKAKMKRHLLVDLYETTIAGCFCKLFIPKEL